MHASLERKFQVMAGARAVQVVSALLKNGPQHLAGLRAGLARFVEERGYASLSEMRGCMNLTRCPDPAAFEPAFKRVASLGVQVYVLTTGPLINSQRQAIADHLLRAKMPAILASAEHAEAGGLMSYAPSYRDNFRRAAAYVDKILKGTKPGDLPIQQPTQFELVVNLKTAGAMGFTIPQSFLLRADRAIE